MLKENVAQWNEKMEGVAEQWKAEAEEKDELIRSLDRRCVLYEKKLRMQADEEEIRSNNK